MPEELLAFGFEIVSSQALKLELEFQFYGEDVEFGFAVFDFRLQRDERTRPRAASGRAGRK